MIYRIIFCMCCYVLFASNSYAQGFVIDSVKYGPDTVYITPDISAAFPGGKARMYEYINLKFDMSADGVGGAGGPKEGIIEASFVVEKNGKIKKVFIGQSISAAYDEEMVRALITMPKWEPALVHNQKVRSLQTIRYSLKFYQR